LASTSLIIFNLHCLFSRHCDETNLAGAIRGVCLIAHRTFYWRYFEKHW